MQEVKRVVGQANKFFIRNIQVNNGKIDLSILLEDLIIYIDPPRLISNIKIEVSLRNRDAIEMGRKLKEAGRTGTVVLQKTETTYEDYP